MRRQRKRQVESGAPSIENLNLNTETRPSSPIVSTPQPSFMVYYQWPQMMPFTNGFYYPWSFGGLSSFEKKEWCYLFIKHLTITITTQKLRKTCLKPWELLSSKFIFGNLMWFKSRAVFCYMFCIYCFKYKCYKKPISSLQLLLKHSSSCLTWFWLVFCL